MVFLVSYHQSKYECPFDMSRLHTVLCHVQYAVCVSAYYNSSDVTMRLLTLGRQQIGLAVSDLSPHRLDSCMYFARLQFSKMSHMCPSVVWLTSQAHWSLPTFSLGIADRGSSQGTFFLKQAPPVWSCCG